jgi:putative membrane protein
MEILGQAMIKLMTFAVGAVLGLKLFSKVLHWMFAHHKNTTLAVLIGFMIGSLNKIWPWKQVLETRLNSHGEEVPFLEKSILPQYFEGNPQIIGAIIMVLFGFVLIVGLEKIAAKFGKN